MGTGSNDGWKDRDGDGVTDLLLCPSACMGIGKALAGTPRRYFRLFLGASTQLSAIFLSIHLWQGLFLSHERWHREQWIHATFVFLRGLEFFPLLFLLLLLLLPCFVLFSSTGCISVSIFWSLPVSTCIISIHTATELVTWIVYTVSAHVCTLWTI